MLALLFVWTGVAWSQGVTVKGVVTSEEDGLPIVGASVLVKGTTQGTITDVDGNFMISGVKADSKTLIVSFVGMKSKEVAIKKGELKIVMKSDAEVLDEVMVVAYGTVKKSAFTGSATVVDQDKIKSPAVSFDKSLAGQVSGVQVMSNSGQPGSGTSFRIRGSGSLKASNEPLYVIDGVATTSTEYSSIAEENESSSNILSSINPNDIESITVLKDAAAAALYGSRAANGVVVITTKSGKEGKARVNFNAQFSWSKLGKAYDMMSSADMYKMIYQGYRAKGETMEEANASAQGALTHNPYNVENPLDENGNVVDGAKLVVDTDWQKEVFRTAPSQDYNMNVSGKNDKTNYFFSIGYTKQGGITPASDFKRYSAKANINTKVNRWFNAGLNVTFSHSIQNTTVESSAGASPLYNALSFPNAVPVYIVDNEGNPVLDDNGNKQYNFTNPVSRDFNPLAIPLMDVNRSKFYRLLASGYAEITFFKGFFFKTVFSPDYVSTDEHRYWNKEHGNGPTYNGRLDKYHHVDLMYTSTNTFNYTNIFKDVHSLNVMAGMEYWQSTYETLYAGGRGLLGDMQELAGASGSFSPSSDTTKETLISYFGRAEYAYKDKYNFSASLRADGSSIFGADTKWGTFWSLGASWRINQEDFLKDIEWIDNLKLRLSYGTSGNKSGLARYASLGLWTTSADYLYGSNIGVGHDQLVNALLGWEKQGMFNVGVDFSFWNRFYGSVDFFNKTSDGLLYDVPLALQNGLSSITMNAAKTSNTGFEIVLGANILRGPLVWNMDLNASFIKDKIKDLNGENDVRMTDYQKIWSVGGSQYEFYMPTWAGVDPDNGSPLWYKVNDDGTRTTTSVYSEATYERQGRSTPLAYGGFINTFSYKNFDLTIQLNYSLGGKIYDNIYAGMMHDGATTAQNMHVDALEAWTTPGQHTNVPKYAVNNATNSASLSSRFLYDATNVKLKTITLSYTLPKNLGVFSKVISGAKLWVSADNLCTWFADKGYKGYDDIDIYGVQGYKTYPYSFPTPRTFSIGANLTF
ncbi:TonB-dependent receptor [Phocaeicola plebeius]|uniref:TonB-dependent receptor n=3 Tax=Phocaeicola plebeius TaxID=310297 RepID=A0A414FXN4_9BACT|nr:TonB-dependent receptor [Phocaeicola plebeius]